MSTPTRRLAPRHDFGMTNIAQRLNTIAPEIDAQWRTLIEQHPEIINNPITPPPTQADK